MPSVAQPKKGEKAAALKEPFAMEVEAEVDRRILCEKLIMRYDIEKAKSGLGYSQYAGGFASGAPDKSAVVIQEGRVATEGTSIRDGVTSAAKKSMQATGMKGARQKTALTKSVVTED